MAFSETLFYFAFLRASHHVVQADFELTRLQLQSIKYRNWSICQPTPNKSVYVMRTINSKLHITVYKILTSERPPM